jgi:cytochrome b
MVSRIRVWDLSLRVFHWAFALCIISALAIALTADDDSPLFRAHMLAGLSAGFMLIVRIIVSVVGGKFSRLTGLLFSPAETVKYLAGTFTGKARRFTGHNPGTANAALGMFLLVILLVVSGLTMSSEIAEDAHKVFAYTMIGLIGAHLLGIALHTIRHKELISLSMITGWKQGEEGTGLANGGTPSGLVVMLLVVLWFFGLSSSFDFPTGKLRIPLTGQTITLGGESSKEAEPAGSEGDEQGDED